MKIRNKKTGEIREVSVNELNQYGLGSNMYKSGGEMIKRADGSYSRKGLWDNIRANVGSGKRPTKEMLNQERKIRNQYQDGGEEEVYWRTKKPMVNDPSMDAISKVLLQRNQDKNFMQRAAGFGNQNSIPTRYIDGQNPNSNDMSSLLMGSGDNYVFPNIVETAPGQLSYQPDQRQEYIQAPTEDIADYFATKGYKRAANDMYGMQYQTGGDVPTIDGPSGYMNEDNVWVVDNETIKKQAQELGAKKVLTEGGSLIIFDDNWNIVAGDDNPNAPYKQGGSVTLNAGGENHRIYVKTTNRGEGDKGNIMVNHPTMDKGMWDTIDLTQKSGAKTIAQGVAATKKWHRENPYMKEYKGDVPMYGPGGQTKPTASDSLAVMNSALAVQKYYDNLTKKGWYKEPIVTRKGVDEYFNPADLNEIEKESLETYTDHFNKPSFYMFSTKSVYPKVTENDIKKKAKQSILDIKNKKPNTYIYKDLAPTEIDEWAPPTLIDMRIKPQTITRYVIKKNDYMVPGGGYTDIMGYDPIAVKPAAMKTASDWAYMQKTYGTKPPVTTSKPPARQTINTTMGQVTGTVRPNQIKGSELMMMINPVRSKENLERMEMIPYTFNNPIGVPHGELLPIPPKQTVNLTNLTETRTHPIEIYDRRGNFLRTEYTGDAEGVVDFHYTGDRKYSHRGGTGYLDLNAPIKEVEKRSNGGGIPMYGPGGQNSPKVYTDKKMFNQAKQNYTDSLFLHNNPVVVDSYFPDAMDLDLNKHVASSFKSATSPLGGTYDVHPIKKINKKILNDLVNDSIKDRTVPDYDDDLELFERRKKRNKVLIDSVLKMKKTGFQPVASTEPGYFGQTMFFKKPVQPVTYQSAPTHPIENLEKLEMMTPSLNGSNIQMQGQLLPIPQMKLPQQGTIPFYGPGNTIIGYTDDNRQFYPLQYSGAKNNQINLQDKELLDNPEMLQKFVQSRDNYKFANGGGIPERYRNMGFTNVGAKKQSTRLGKKWMVLAKKGDDYKVVHGGYKGMQDFKQHHSEQRKENFWSRMGGRNSSKATDPFSPLYWHKRFGTWEYGGQPMAVGGQNVMNPIVKKDNRNWLEYLKN